MPEPALYEHYRRERWDKEGVELIVSCGDLNPGYLDFLVSTFNVPCFYVRGNHDTTYDQAPLGGCVNLHERVVPYKGVKFFGLEGSRWYNGGPAQYTEREMWWKTHWAGWTLRRAGGADVFVAHSAPRMCPLPERHCRCVHPPPGTPPAHLGQICYLDHERCNWELADLPHRGFDSVRQLILKFQPRLFLHGHTHLGYGTRPRELRLGRTRVIDAYGHVLLDV
jgi:Icc-related predicted phosphoesterase